MVTHYAPITRDPEKRSTGRQWRRIGRHYFAINNIYIVREERESCSWGGAWGRGTQIEITRWKYNKWDAVRKCPRTWKEGTGMMKNAVEWGKQRRLLNFQYARSGGDSLICVFNKSLHRIMPQIQMAEQCLATGNRK